MINWIKNKFPDMYFIAKELFFTFSNQPSILSSKRIERFLIFTSMLLATLVFLYARVFNCNNFDSSELMIVIVGWLGYGGFNTVKIQQDNKKDENKTNLTDNNFTDTK